jgi:cysteine desulfurase
MGQKRTVYLDYSASTPTDPRVVEKMMPYFSEIYGNPSSLHAFGRKAESAIESSREAIATILNCKPSEVIFTSGGSEGDNLALRGVGLSDMIAQRRRMISTLIEHSAITRTLSQMQELLGVDVSYVSVDSKGVVDAHELAELAENPPGLVTICYANNEVGTVQPLADLATIAHAKGAYFHTDAVQAGGLLDLDTQRLGIDLLSLSAHKFYGPKGVGLLYARSGLELVPSQSGGSHEAGRRAGTLNTPFIVGMAHALVLAHEDRALRRQLVEQRRDQLIHEILDRVEDAELTGHPQQRLPSHSSFLFKGVDGNKLVMHLDMRGVAASSASACKVGNPEPSSVLLAMGYSPEDATGSLRLTVSHLTTEDEIDYAVHAVVESVHALRKLQRKTVF